MERTLVILLDTNYLIRMLVKDSEESKNIKLWLGQKEELCTSSIAWYEFLSGPVDGEGISLVKKIVRGKILAFSEKESQTAANLFNQTGRVRKLRVDGMIAATALEAKAKLATSNKTDFQNFQSQGLELI